MLVSRDPSVREVDLVELGLARHLPERAHVHARSVHVHDKGGEPGVLGHLRVGPDDQQAPLRHVRERRPDLLAVHDPLVAVTHSS
jgi:hypothetical protein